MKQDFKKILELKDKEKTILFTTHRMHVANAVCDRIALIKKGKIVKLDTAKNLKKLIMDRLSIDIEIKEHKNQLLNELEGNDFVLDIVPNNSGFNIHIKNREK